MNRDNFKEQYEQNFTNCYYLEIREINKLLQRDYYVKATNDIKNVAAENRERIAPQGKETEPKKPPYDQETTDEICHHYFESNASISVATIVDFVIQAKHQGFDSSSKLEQRKIKGEVKANVEEVLDQYMIKNFAQSDEKIADGHDYITDTQFETFEPKYKIMTGMQDERTVDKLWKDIKVIKIDSVVAKSRKANNWSYQIEQRYKNLMDKRAKE